MFFSRELAPSITSIYRKVVLNACLLACRFIVGLELDPAKLRADAKISMAISAVGELPTLIVLIRAVPLLANCVSLLR